MKIKRFFAKDMRTALAEVKETLGNDAVIMSNKRVTGGVEIVAAIDFDHKDADVKSTANAGSAPMSPRTEPERSLKEDRVSINAPTPANTSSPDSLKALLEQQQARREKSQSLTEPKTEQSLPAWAQRAFEPEKKPAQTRPAQIERRASRLQERSSGKVNEELSEMKAEMASIRQLLQHQVSNLMHQDMARAEPVKAMLLEQLRDLGFNKEVAEHFVSLVPEQAALHEAIQYLPDLIAAEVNCSNERIFDEGGVIALVGPTGVGKTTTIAKLAARFVAKYGVEQVALVTTDNYRIGAHEQLVTFGKIMGCPVRSAAGVEELEEVLYQLRSRRLVLIDTAGMGQRDMRLVEQLEQLTRSNRLPIKPYLVLSATAQYKVLLDTVERFQRIDLAGCLLTKLDEAQGIGEALSVLIQKRLPVSYLTNGQRVPEDLRPADPQYLAERALAGEGDEILMGSSARRKNVAGLYE